MTVATSFACADCGANYTMTEKEVVRFTELSKTLPDFKMPRRCSDCRYKRRLEKAKIPSAASVAPAPVAPAAVPTPPAPVVVAAEKKQEPQEPIIFERPPRKTATVLVAGNGVMPLPDPLPVKQEAVPEPAPKEIVLVLATKDFDDLVNGRPVVWRGVRVVLADIGYSNMKKAIEEAELEKAKRIVKANQR